MSRFAPSTPHSLSKLRQLKAVAKRTGGTTLIETGTFKGNTAMRASYLFQKVITIEVDQKLHKSASEYLARRENVECVLGDCALKLPEILGRPDVDDCVIFLDGHYSGGETGMADTEEPAIEEIESIAAFQPKVKGIVIDDFRMFTGIGDMPSKAALIRSIETFLPDYRLTVHLDQVLVEKKIHGIA